MLLGLKLDKSGERHSRVCNWRLVTFEGVMKMCLLYMEEKEAVSRENSQTERMLTPRQTTQLLFFSAEKSKAMLTN